MKRIVLWSLAALMCMMVIPAFAGDQDFTLIHKTGLTVDAFYCSATTTNYWEEDILGQDVLEDGQQVLIKFHADTEACHYDLMIVDEEGDKIVWSDINLCEVTHITLYYKDGKPTASLENKDEEEEE